jgi:hypothetical protein
MPYEFQILKTITGNLSVFAKHTHWLYDELSCSHSIPNNPYNPYKLISISHMTYKIEE